MTKKIKVVHLFETYPIFYQPYMQLYEKELGKEECLNVKVVSFKNSSDKSVTVMPSYFLRNLMEKIGQVSNRQYRKLNYFEIYAKRQNADIIHIQDSYLFNKVTGMSLLSNKIKPKIVLTMRGAETYTKPWIFKKWKSFYKYYKDNINAYVVMSEHQKNYLHDKWQVAMDKIHVIPISFGEKFIQEPKNPNKKIIKIVSVFRLYWAKNITDNLKLVKTIKDLGYSIEYDIYGNGPDAEHIYFLRDKYNLHQNVRIMGVLDNKILKKKLFEYDFIFQLSITESLGMSVIEAQSLGVPAVVSDTGGLVEVIVDGESGYIFENFDITAKKIIHLWENSLYYCSFSQKAVEYAHSKFSVDLEIEKTVALYKSLME